MGIEKGLLHLLLAMGTAKRIVCWISRPSYKNVDTDGYRCRN